MASRSDGLSFGRRMRDGDVERQVKAVTERFFQPKLQIADLEALNAWLEVAGLRWAAAHPHSEPKDPAIAQILEAERPA